MTGLGIPSSAACDTERLFSECRDSLIRYLRYHIEDASEAEDIAQEAFVRFFQTRCEQKSILQPRAWLFRVAHNLLIDHGRKKKPELMDDKGWIAMEGRLIAPVRSIENSVYVSQLPWQRLSPMELESLRLRTEGLKLREIAEVLGLSISTVVSYVARAVNKLRAIEVEVSEPPKHGRAPAAV